MFCFQTTSPSYVRIKRTRLFIGQNVRIQFAHPRVIVSVIMGNPSSHALQFKPIQMEKAAARSRRTVRPTRFNEKSVFRVVANLGQTEWRPCRVVKRNGKARPVKQWYSAFYKTYVMDGHVLSRHNFHLRSCQVKTWCFTITCRKHGAA